MFGSAIGIYNFVHARIQEGRAKKLDATDLELYRALQAETSQRGADFITPPLGSPLQQWAERMVKRGYMHEQRGAYSFEYLDFNLPQDENDSAIKTIDDTSHLL